VATSDHGVAPVGAGLREPHLARRPSRSPWPSEHPDLVRPVRLDSEHLVVSGLSLARRKPEYLAGRAPDLQLLMVLIPKCQQRSLHRDSFPGEWTLLAAAQLQVHAMAPEKQHCRTACLPSVVPRLSAEFRQTDD